MADISQITLPSGTTYNIKDTVARQAASGGMVLRGKTTTALEDGATTNPIQIEGSSYTAVNQDCVIYGNKEFIFDGTTWYELGDTSGLGDLAYKDSASGSFTPAGTIALTTSTETPTISGAAGTAGDNTFQASGSVSAPTISVDTAGTTGTFATTVDTAAPGATAPSNAITYYSVQNEVLSLYQIGYSTDSAKTGDASYEATAPTFTGDYVKLTSGSVSVPTAATFTGTTDTVTVE